MIETREQYTMIKAALALLKQHGTDVYDGTIETIEALREVARAAKTVIQEELWDWESQGNRSLRELESRIEGVPEWLLEE